VRRRHQIDDQEIDRSAIDYWFRVTFHRLDSALGASTGAGPFPILAGRAFPPCGQHTPSRCTIGNGFRGDRP